ncbi:hypothetical protein AAE02nite_23090 [Adhaeribacter aerolatus]|uniref:Uncharacterized protein n=1 Tax=Adhaeribacter aerolatus TaxID=670289 RepID=A0A512AY50_9BACT|nr:hypothetical protein [Adhaeribacter aerolatus]GEO04645.1 hypothetical protein AAE02nite_23090 [Adhaeribacter aerolatus]
MFRKLVGVYANILHLRFTDAFAKLPPATLQAISPNTLLGRLTHILLYIGGRLVLNIFLPLRNPEDIKGKIWLYVVSKNNYESLQFLREKLPDSVFVAGQNKEIGIYNPKVNRLSTRSKLLYYYKFLPLLWGLNRLKGKRALRFFDLIFVATGYYELSRRYLQKYKPTAIIFANDHNTDPRALLLAANELSIPTIYIQHASVSTSFPPLQFSLSLLEGQDALDKYRQCGPITGEVKLIGMPKADKYLHDKNLSSSIRRVGVAANIIDEIAPIRDLLADLSREFPDIIFTLRPHPGDKRDFSFIKDIKNNVRFSDGKKEQAFDFLKQQDALIAADSSIHLEATMLNILCFYYRFNTTEFIPDYYGYVKQGLVEQANDANHLMRLLHQYRNHRPLVYERARYYNAVLGTEYEGRSHELAVKYIQEHLKA